jgi:hypothetical protein
MKKIIVIFFIVLSTSITSVSAFNEDTVEDYSKSEFSNPIILESVQDDYKQEKEIQSYGLDEKGNIVLISDKEFWSTEEKGISFKKILVRIASFEIGYLTGKIQDGIIISLSGNTPEFWFSQAARNLVGKSYTSSYRVNCSEWPPNSYYGAKCRAY